MPIRKHPTRSAPHGEADLVVTRLNEELSRLGCYPQIEARPHDGHVRMLDGNLTALVSCIEACACWTRLRSLPDGAGYYEVIGLPLPGNWHLEPLPRNTRSHG